MTDAGGGAPSLLDRRQRTAGIAASAALVLIVVVLAVVGGNDSGAAGPGFELGFVTAEELVELEAELGHAVYWVGEQPPDRIELKREANGEVFLRYLPPGVELGADPAGYLTVGTYPVPDAVAATRRYARDSGTSAIAGPDGSVMVANLESAGSVYVAFPGSDLQIEVFDPSPRRALALVRGGELEPVGEG